MGIGSVLGAAGSLLDGGKSSTIERLTQENALLKKQILELEEQGKALTKSIQNHRDQLKDQEDEVEELEDEIADLKKKLKARDAEISQLKDEVSSLQQANRQLSIELEERG